MKQDLVIDAKDVHKEYLMGRVKVVAIQNLSLEIRRGDMVCISGRSGSGKSTLLRQLSLIDTPQKGIILINDQDTSGLSEQQRSERRLSTLGYVFQEYALISELTAQENVALPAIMLHGKRTVETCMKRAAHLLREIGMGDRLTHRPGELSGGQQQRVAIPRSSVNEPTIVFADEPTANLDSISARSVMETLKELNEKHGVTVLFVSHDPEDIIYATRVITLKDGSIIDDKEKNA